MKIKDSYKYIIATVLIVISLVLPATKFAIAATLELGLTSTATYSTTTTAPCDNCPCSDGQGSDCCDATICSCECYAPLGQGVQLSYAPMIATHNFPEPSCSLPQVYRPIFVPPQSQA